MTGSVRGGWLTGASDLARLVMLAAAAAFLLAGDGAAALKTALVLVPAAAARLAGIPPAFELLFVLALGTEAIASALGAYDSISWGDTLSHTVLPLLCGPVLYAGLVRLDRAVPRAPAIPDAPLGAAIVATVSVLALGAAWELVEWAADSALGTEYTQGQGDTRADLRNDAIAAIGSGGLVALWRQRSREPVR